MQVTYIQHKHENKGLENKLQRSFYESSPVDLQDYLKILSCRNWVFDVCPPKSLLPISKIVLKYCSYLYSRLSIDTLPLQGCLFAILFLYSCKIVHKYCSFLFSGPVVQGTSLARVLFQVFRVWEDAGWSAICSQEWQNLLCRLPWQQLCCPVWRLWEPI